MSCIYNAVSDNEEKFIHIEKLNKNYKINNNFMIFYAFLEKQEEAEANGTEIKIKDVIDLVKNSLGTSAFNEIMKVTTFNDLMSIFEIISASYNNITPAQLKKRKESGNDEANDEESGM